MSTTYSWDEIRNQVRQFRADVQVVYPMHVLITVKDFSLDAEQHQLYFLSNGHAANDKASRHPTLYKANYSCLFNDADDSEAQKAGNFHSKHKASEPSQGGNLALIWTRVFTEYALRPTDEDKNTTYEKLLYTIQGVSYFERDHSRIMFTFNGGIFVSETGRTPLLIQPRQSLEQPASLSDSSTSPPKFDSFHAGPRPQTPPAHTLITDQYACTDPKIGGYNNEFIAFIRLNDIWVTTLDGNEIQLTFCSQSDDPTLSAGVAEYIMQEEFHRYTAYYWGPNIDSSINRILYLQTSEHDIDSVILSKTACDKTNSDTVHSIRYPRAGRKNAKSSLRIVEFSTSFTGLDIIITEKDLYGAPFMEQLLWAEYIVRFGWLPTGTSVWAQLLSRDQTRTMVVKISCSQFIPKEVDQSQRNVDGSTEEPFEILWEEVSQTWVNVSDVFYFFRHVQKGSTKFIWSSEKSGYRHLYLVTCHGDGNSMVQQLTSGNWCVMDKPIYVDERRKLVYFIAKLDTPLEAHLYVTSFADNTGKMVRLTELGSSHTITMDPQTLDVFVDCYSSLHQPQSVSIRRLIYTKASSLPQTSPLYTVMLLQAPAEQETLGSDQPVSPPRKMPIMARPTSLTVDQGDFKESILTTAAHPRGNFFDFLTSNGTRLYGCLYKPRCYQAGKSYPTVLHIYGGPKTQMVTNEFKFPRLARYLVSTYFGFVVLMIDGRGSCDRGLSFESHIRHRLGMVEIQDQLEGLRYVCESRVGAMPDANGHLASVVDMSRVAISGWSYGGYLSLMGLAQHPSVFKIAIAGAPVTQWEMYDSAYTERYMGFPDENEACYQSGSVLGLVNQFPDNENRLLLAHGLLDENVHYRHTELLVTELNRHNKPHFLQVYPTEKHGLRHASVNEHFETLMFYWLVNHL